MGKGSSTNTSTTSSAPPLNFQNALTGALNNTTNTAATPYQQYTGNLQAGFSPDQQAGFGMIENSAGMSSPYINSAANYIDASTAPLQPALQPYSDAAMQQYQAGTKSTGQSFAPYASAAAADFNRAGQQLTPQQYSAQAIQAYQNPYTQSVVDATQAQFNNTNAQQFNQLQGNAASAGALGGDRVGVAQGVMAGQQAAAQNPVIAGLYNQGFNQAQQEFNTQQGVDLNAQAQSQQLALAAGQGMTGLGNQALTSAQGDAARNLQAGQGIAGLGSQNLSAAQAQAWLNSQAGFGMANLGNQAQNSQLQSAQALLGAGNQQQAQAQTSLNIPYQQYQAQQSYPFQVGNWLNSGVEGLSATAGGSGVSTSPGPSPFSQVAGLGIAGAGIYGAAGGFNSSGSGSSGYGGPSGISPSVDSALSNAAAMNGGAYGEAFGGRVIRRAPGGAIPGFGPPPIQVPGGANGGVPDVSAGYLPAGGDVAVHTSSAPKVTTTTGPAPESTLGSIVRAGVDIAASVYGTPIAGIAADSVMRGAGIKRGGAIHGFAGGGVTIMPSSHAGGVGVPQITGFGGGSSAPVSTGGLDKYLSDTQATAAQKPVPAPAPAAAPQQSQGFNADQLLQQLQNLGFQAKQWIPEQALPSLNGDSGGGMSRGGFLRGFADGGAPDDSDIPLPPPDPGFGAAPSAVPAPSSLDAVKRLGDLGSKIHDVPSSANPWLALMTAGFGIAAGKSPHALENIGAGALQGVQQYTSEDRAAKQLASRVDEARAHLSLSQAQGEQTGAYQQGELTARQKQLEQTGELTRAQMDQRAELAKAQMGQALAMHNSSLGQAASLAAQHMALQRDQMSQDAILRREGFVPPEAREAEWLANASPEKQDALQQLRGNKQKFTYQAVTQPDPDDPTKTIPGVLKMPMSGDGVPEFVRTDTNPNKPGANGMGSRSEVFFNRIVSAGNEANAATKNLMELPVESSSGWFGGRTQGTGLLSAAKESLTNTLTPQNVQDYNSMMPGVARSLAAIETSGLAPSGALTHSMDSLTLKQGDTEVTKMRKMAEIRQIVEKGLEPNLSNPRIPPEQKKFVQGIIDDMRQTVPFTHHDITALQSSKSSGQTLNGLMEAKGLGKAPAGAPSGQQPVQATPSIPRMGDVQDGYRFLGGDPANPKSWQQQ